MYKGHYNISSLSVLLNIVVLNVLCLAGCICILFIFTVACYFITLPSYHLFIQLLIGMWLLVLCCLACENSPLSPGIYKQVFLLGLYLGMGCLSVICKMTSFKIYNQARHSAMFLQSQHSGSWVRRITGWRPDWATLSQETPGARSPWFCFN